MTSAAIMLLLGSLVRASLHAAVLAMLVAIISATLRNRIPASWRFGLWLLVFVPLLVPFRIPIRLPVSWGTHATAPVVAAVISHSSFVDLSPRIVQVGGGSASPLTIAPTVAKAPDIWAVPVSRFDIPVPLMLAAAWLAGIAFCLARLLRGSVRLRRMLRGLQLTDDPKLIRELEIASRLIGLHRSPAAILTPDGLGPALAGCWRPTLLVPQSLVGQLEPRELGLVLLHELAHLRRRDVPINCIVSLLAAVHWFNPLVWWALARLREERELACDERALAAASGEVSPVDYGHLLLNLIQPVSAATVRAAPAAVGMFERRHSLNRRIAMIARYRNGNRLHPIVGVALVVPLLAVAFTDAAAPFTPPIAALKSLSAISEAAPIPAAPAVVALPAISYESFTAAINRGETPAIVQESVARDASVVQLRRVIEDVDRKLELMSTAYGPAHPAMQQMKQTRSSLEQQYEKIRAEKTADVIAAIKAALKSGDGSTALARLTVETPAVADPNNAAVVPTPSPSVPATPAAPEAAPAPAVTPAPSPAASTLAVDSDTQGNAAVNAVLSRRLPELHFNANSFGDVIDLLRDITGANIFVNWGVLEAAGISKDAPVTLRVRDVTFSTALDLILQSVGANTELAYTIEGGVIRITTAEKARGRIVVQTYDVSKMIKADEDVDQLRKLIMSNVSANNWKDNGGVVGSIEVFKSKLVVSTTALDQQKIVALLESLADRDAVAAQSDGVTEATVVHTVHVPKDRFKEIERLWFDEYAPRIVIVNGKPANSAEIEKAFHEDVEKRLAASQNAPVAK